jgi:hypothetical protein
VSEEGCTSRLVVEKSKLSKVSRWTQLVDHNGVATLEGLCYLRKHIRKGQICDWTVRAYTNFALENDVEIVAGIALANNYIARTVDHRLQSIDDTQKLPFSARS